MTGSQGAFGGNAFEFTFSTTTAAADPGNGTMRLNNATIASATAFYVDDLDVNGTNIATWLLSMDDGGASGNYGYLRIYKKTAPSIWAVFKISSAIVANSGYSTITVVYVTGAGSLANADAVVIDFTSTGATGAQGLQGTAGTPGTQGNQGAPGAQGNQGFQGNQTTYFIQGAQQNLSAQTLTNIVGLTSGALVNAGVYDFEFVVGHQAAAGVQGAQFAVQSSTGAGTLEAQLWGTQTGVINVNKRMNVVGGIQTAGLQAGDNSIWITGVYVASGTPTLGLQVKGVQASQAHAIRANSMMKITRIS